MNQPTKPTALIVDDEPDIRELLDITRALEETAGTEQQQPKNSASPAERCATA